MESILIGIKQGDLKYFDDSIDLSAQQPYKIHTIKIFFSNQAILGIQVYYYSFKSQQIIKCKEHKVGKLFGVSESKIVLLDDEHVIRISGYQTPEAIMRLEIKTNRQELVIGVQDGTKFEHKIEDNKQLGAIAGGLTKQLSFLEWTVQPKQALEPNQIYSWQLYQLYTQQYQQPIINDTFQLTGRTYRVCEPKIIENVQIGGVMTKRQVYFKIINDQNEIIYRRFREVSQLREILLLRWPGIYTPPLMNKQFLEDYSNEQIEAERRSIEYFLIKLAKIPFFIGTVEFGVFINKTNKEQLLEMDFVYTQLKEMTKEATIEQIKLRYQQTFEEFEKTQPVNEEQRAKVNQFTQLMSRLEANKISEYSDLKRLFEANSKNLNQLSRYILPELQDLHSQEQAFRQRSNSCEKAVQLSIDSMNEIYEFFQQEQREASNLLTSLNYIKSIEQQRDKLELKLDSNKLKQDEYTQLKDKHNQLQTIWSILVKAYSNYYIDNFYQERYQLFVFMMNRLSTIQLNNLKLKQNFWLAV